MGMFDGTSLTAVWFCPAANAPHAAFTGLFSLRRLHFAPTESEQREISASTRLTVGTLDERYRIAKPSDQKKQIQHWNLAGVSDLTPMQLTKINALAPDDPKRALEWLSSRQRRGLTSPLADYARTH